MASNLTRGWIQYLKNNQIVALQSDPKSGRLTYKKPVTASDVVHFLQVDTDYTDDQINQAIDQVVGRQSGQRPNSNLASVQHPPGNSATPGPTPNSPGQKTSKYAATNQDAEDVEDVSARRRPELGAGRKGLPAPAEQSSRTGGKIKGQVSQTPNAIRKRQARANRKGSLNEDFVDNPGEKLSEKQVEAIFKILVGSSARPSPAEKDTSVDPQKVRVEELNKLKRFIRDTLSEQQRMSLWRALQDE